MVRHRAHPNIPMFLKVFRCYYCVCTQQGQQYGLNTKCLYFHSWYWNVIMAVSYPHKERHSWDCDSEETLIALGDTAKNMNINMVEKKNNVKKTFHIGMTLHILLAQRGTSKSLERSAKSWHPVILNISHSFMTDVHVDLMTCLNPVLNCVIPEVLILGVIIPTCHTEMIPKSRFHPQTDCVIMYSLWQIMLWRSSNNSQVKKKIRSLIH